MPQIDIKLSRDVDLDVETFFTTLAAQIKAYDPSVGPCKTRLFVADDASHCHIYIVVRLMPKAERDEVFMQDLLSKLKTAVEPYLPNNTYYSLELKFLSRYYYTALKD